jgi:hypothetical protein
MIEETYFKIQPSEGIVCDMASRLLAAFITSGQLTTENEVEMIERSANLAIKLAYTIDKHVESDDENGNR